MDETPLLPEVLELYDDPRTMKTFSTGAYLMISNVAVDTARVPPPLLGPRVVKALASVRDDQRHTQPEPDEQNKLRDVVPRLNFHQPLRPHPVVQREQEDAEAMGGMRNPRKAVKRQRLDAATW